MACPGILHPKYSAICNFRNTACGLKRSPKQEEFFFHSFLCLFLWARRDCFARVLVCCVGILYFWVVLGALWDKPIKRIWSYLSLWVCFCPTVIESYIMLHISLLKSYERHNRVADKGQESDLNLPSGAIKELHVDTEDSVCMIRTLVTQKIYGLDEEVSTRGDGPEPNYFN